MRLLHTETFQLQSFEVQRPEYAILSHRWGEDELLFEHVNKPGWAAENLSFGAKKVLSACRQAREDGFAYLWVDTCCIDKTSSAELSEAINSMFHWYNESEICYAFLVDVQGIDDFSSSNWWTRGWTLQELIAPTQLRFYDTEWNFIGSRKELATQIAYITHIQSEILKYHDHRGQIRDMLDSISVATRLSWNSSRMTTRAEDRTYCLLGLFDVNMPLLYGERSNAFPRLMEQIVRKTHDPSVILVNPFDYESNREFGKHPSSYKNCELLRRLFLGDSLKSRLTMSDQGLMKLDTFVWPCTFPQSHRQWQLPSLLAILDVVLDDGQTRIGVMFVAKFNLGSRQIFYLYDDSPFFRLRELSPGVIHGTSPLGRDALNPTQISFVISAVERRKFTISTKSFNQAAGGNRASEDIVCHVQQSHPFNFTIENGETSHEFFLGRGTYCVPARYVDDQLRRFCVVYGMKAGSLTPFMAQRLWCKVLTDGQLDELLPRYAHPGVPPKESIWNDRAMRDLLDTGSDAGKTVDFGEYQVAIDCRSKTLLGHTTHTLFIHIGPTTGASNID